MSNNQNNINQLFNTAVDEGDLTKGSKNLLLNIPDIGQTINQGLGIPPDQIKSSEVILVTVLVDDSGSIRSSGNEQPMRDGYNLLRESLIQTKQLDNIIVQARYLNGKVLTAYQPVDKIPVMDKGNYQATGGTPLYDESCVTLGTVMAKYLDLKNNGIQTRTITVIMTDGEDCGSNQHDASDVKTLIDDMMRDENHIVAGVAFDNGRTTVRDTFQAMGVPDAWILTVNNTATDIRKAFALVSKSASVGSKSAANFATTKAGGFGG